MCREPKSNNKVNQVHICLCLSAGTFRVCDSVSPRNSRAHWRFWKVKPVRSNPPQPKYSPFAFAVAAASVRPAALTALAIQLSVPVCERHFQQAAGNIPDRLMNKGIRF